MNEMNEYVLLVIIQLKLGYYKNQVYKYYTV